MHIHSADFLTSSPSVSACPKTDLPEYAFIGRSNVGKSSLINALTDRKALAKTSSRPGKTQLINHFTINSEWHLVDLPGYGYAKLSKAQRKAFEKLINDYLLKRSNLVTAFVLLDSRHEPMAIDLEFMEWMGVNGIPFTMVFTKVDKISPKQLEKNIQNYGKKMKEVWEELPVHFQTSATTKAGREEILNYIEECTEKYQ